MAAPTLVHERRTNSAANTNDTVGTAVPASRARVGKIIIVNSSSSATCNINVYIGTATAADAVVLNYQLPPKSVYTESAIVMRAGESFIVNAIDLPVGNITSCFMGEEVDN